MRIVSSHFVPLNPPYPIIYCKGELGLQTGTLIVVEDNYGDDPSVRLNRESGKPYLKFPYGITSHSHPVVTYGNKEKARPKNIAQPNDWSENIVWDKVEMRDVTTLCYSDDSVIDYERIAMFVSSERSGDMFRGNYVFKLHTVVGQLKRMGFPTIFKDEYFNSNGCGQLTLLKGGLKPGVNSLISNHIMGLPYLFIACQWGKDSHLEDDIITQIEDYRIAIAPREVKIMFNYRDEEVRPIADHLNALYNK